MPRMIGLSVYRLDINFRESAVVGIVGGGGIGATLNTSFSRYEFDTAARDTHNNYLNCDGYGIYVKLYEKVGAVMPTITNNGTESWCLRTSKEQWIRWVCWLIGIAIIMYAWQMISEKTVWFFVTDAP